MTTHKTFTAKLPNHQEVEIDAVNYNGDKWYIDHIWLGGADFDASDLWVQTRTGFQLLSDSLEDQINE